MTRNATVGSGRRGAGAGGRSPPARVGRPAADGLPELARAVHVHAGRGAAVRDPPAADPGVDPDGSRASPRGRWISCSVIPGDARVTTTEPHRGTAGNYELWLSDGEMVRTYSAPHKLGTNRPVRHTIRGLDRRTPATSRARRCVYEPLTPLPMETLPDTFVHPGRLLPERARDRPLLDLRDGDGQRAAGDRRRVRPPADDRGRRGPAGLPRPDRRGPSRRRRSSDSMESIGGEVTRRADGRRIRPGRADPAGRVRVRVPVRHDDALLGPGPLPHRGRGTSAPRTRRV